MKKLYSFLVVLSVLVGKMSAAQCYASFQFSVAGNTVQFYSAGAPDSLTSHIWYFGDGGNSSLANPSHTYANCGTYTVYHGIEKHDASGAVICHDSAFQVLTIVCNTPCSAVASFNALAVNNQPNVFEFVNTSQTSPNTAVTCLWNFGDGYQATSTNLANQVHTYTSAGTYNVCLVVTSGQLGSTNVCRDTFCLTVTVQTPTPTPCNLQASYTYANSGYTYTFVNASTGFAPGDSIRWNFGNGNISTSTNPTFTFAGPGTYVVCLRVKKVTAAGAAPCVSETCDSVIVSPLPCSIAPWFAYNISGNAAPFVVQFTNQSTPASIQATVTWNFGDGGSGAGYNATHTYAQAGTYTVCMTVATGTNCVRDTCRVVVINPTPNPCNLVASFNIGSISGNTITINNTSTGFAAGDSIRWNFGDGTYGFDLNPTHTYAQAGTYNVCLRISRITSAGTPCVSEICHPVVIASPTPCNVHASFTFIDSNNLVYFVNTSTTGTTTINGVYSVWNFGDGSPIVNSPGLVNQTHSYLQTGTYTVCLKVLVAQAGANITCVDSICHTITVTVAPPAPCNVHASFTASSSNGVGQFVNTSTTGSTTLTGVYSVWNFGDGSPAVSAAGLSNQFHTYAQSGTYVVCLKVLVAQPSSNITCIDSVCQNVQIQVPSPLPCNLVPTFTATPSPNDSNVYIFTNTTVTANAPQVIWTFGDNTTASGNIVTHIFNQPGTYNVCMHIAVSNTCSADTCITVTVTGTPNPPPCNLSAHFSWQNSPATPNVIYFLNASTGLAPGDSISWHFGDGTASGLLNPVHTFAAPGTYNVCLRIYRINAGGTVPCVSEVCHSIVIPPSLVAYPNPATSIVNVNVSLNNAGPIYAFLYNSQNMLLAQQIITGMSGMNTITFNTQNLPSGQYTIRVYYDGHFSVARFIK